MPEKSGDFGFFIRDHLVRRDLSASFVQKSGNRRSGNVFSLPLRYAITDRQYSDLQPVQGSRTRGVPFTCRFLSRRFGVNPFTAFSALFELQVNIRNPQGGIDPLREVVNRKESSANTGQGLHFDPGL